MTVSASSHAPFVRVAGALLGLAALLAALVATASPASAHARLESSSPADGSTLTAVPPEVMLRFNEPIKDGLNEVSVKSGSTDVAQGEVEVDGSSVYQPLDYSMEPGEYTVTYKVASADGHAVSGTFSFTYEPPEGDRGAGADPSASESPSGSASGEEPSETSGTSSPTSDEATGAVEETGGDDGVSPWWWAAAAAMIAILLGGAGLLAKGRRSSGEDEEVTTEDWRE